MDKDKLIQLYKEKLNDNGYFRKTFWEGEEGRERGLILLRYLIEEKLKLSWTDIVIKFKRPLLKQYRLWDFVESHYATKNKERETVKLFFAIHDLYPENEYLIKMYHAILDTDVRFLEGVWEGEEGKKRGLFLLRYLFENIMDWSMEDIREKLSRDFLVEKRLWGFITSVYSNRIFQAVKDVYPDIEFTCRFCGAKFKPEHRFTPDYCNNKCKSKHFYKSTTIQKREAAKIEGICQYCFKEPAIKGVTYGLNCKPLVEPKPLNKKEE